MRADTDPRRDADVADSAVDMALSQHVLRSSALNYAGKFIVLVVGFALTPFVLHRIGSADFGLWVLVTSIVGFGSLLDLGISAALVKYVAEAYARNDVDRASTFVSTSVALYAVLGVIALAATAVAAPLLPHLFDLQPRQEHVAQWVAILTGLGLALSIPGAAGPAILRGTQRFDLTNLLSVAAALGSAAATVLVLLAGGGVVGLAAVGVATVAIVQLPTVWLVHRVVPGLRIRRRGVSRAILREVLGFSTSVSIVQVASRLQLKSDALIIGATLPVQSVTPFSLAVRLADVVVLVADQFVKVVLPLASASYADRDVARLRPLFVGAMRITLAVSAPVACVLIALAPDILGVWVGAEYRPYANLAVILVVSSLLNVLMWPTASVAQATNRFRPLALLALANGVANVALSIALVGPLGLTGVALGTLVPTALELVLVLAWYTPRLLALSRAHLVRHALFPCVVPIAALGATLLLLRRETDPRSLPELALVAVASLAVYAAAYVAVGASELERRTYRRAATRFVAFLR